MKELKLTGVDNIYNKISSSLLNHNEYNYYQLQIITDIKLNRYNTFTNDFYILESKKTKKLYVERNNLTHIKEIYDKKQIKELKKHIKDLKTYDNIIYGFIPVHKNNIKEIRIFKTDYKDLIGA